MVTTKWQQQSGDSNDKVPDKNNIQTLNACLLWAVGVLEVVAGVVGQSGSKSNAKWQGGREKVITTQKWRL